MPAPKRISDAKVMEAIQTWRGCVKAAAEFAGMTPNNLRKRLGDLGVDLKLLRRLQGAHPNDPHRNGATPNDPERTKGAGMNVGTRNDGRARSDSRALYQSAKGGPRLIGVEATAVKAEAEPIKAVPLRPVPIRLQPEQQERLRDGRLDLQARFRVETNDNTILQQFFDESFEGWIKEKLSRERATALGEKRKDGNGEKGRGTK